jgi:gluconokinase
VLALDVGTSSCRASLFDAGGLRVPIVGAQAPYVPRVTHDGGAELDADALMAWVADVIDGVTTAAGPASIAAVGISTFWHSLLGVNSDGNAITPVYLWLDARSRSAAELLKQQLDEQQIHARTGCVLHWSYWPAKLRWLSQAQPQVFDSVARWMSFGEYLALKLFGWTKVSMSMASATGLLDQHTRTWDSEVLDALDLAPDRLSPIVTRHEPFVGLRPEFASRWPSLREAPWLPALGDGACSNIGAGCTTRDRFALMIGTSGAMRVLWRADDVAIPSGAWCYHADRDHFILGGALNDGGSLFSWLRGALRLPVVEESERAVSALAPDGHGLTIFPAWGGERSPGWADDARGAIVGMRLNTTPIDILRASLEAIALRFRAVDIILRQVVPEAQEIVATGGALLHSPAWLQIMADVLGRPIIASAEPEASSRGAALLALDSIARLPGGIEGLVPQVKRIYDPVPAHAELYRAAAERQERLYHEVIHAPLARRDSERPTGTGDARAPAGDPAGDIVITPNVEALSEAAADFLVRRASEAITTRGRFTVALTGGSTPRQLYELLAAAPWSGRLDWGRCHVFWGDERMVARDHQDSNFRLAHSALLAHVPIPAEQIHRIVTESGDPAAQAAAYEADIRSVFGLTTGERPRFDLVLLGLGADGHIASLFPGSTTIDEARRLVVASPPGRLPPQVDRVTLTLPVFNAARAVAFLVCGPDKAPALRRALAGDAELPASHVKPDDGVLRWFVDVAAAREIEHADG